MTPFIRKLFAPKAPTTIARKASLALEALGDRRVPAVFTGSVGPIGWTYNDATKVFTVNGTESADNFTLTERFNHADQYEDPAGWAHRNDPLGIDIVIQGGNDQGGSPNFAYGTVAKVVVNAKGGNDTVSNATRFASTLNGGAGNDFLTGGSGGDVLAGDAGNDVLNGGAGNDALYGHNAIAGSVAAGDDVLIGGLGNDTLRGGGGADQLWGDARTTVKVGGVWVYRSGTAGGTDQLFGEGGDDVLVGGAGNDSLEGGLGNDFLFGGAGNDTLRGGAGNDKVLGGDGTDQLFGEAGDDLTWLTGPNDPAWATSQYGQRFTLGLPPGASSADTATG